MNTLAEIYSTGAKYVRKPNPQELRQDVYERHAMDPAYYHRYAGFFPVLIPQERARIELEQYPIMMFQHDPKYAYFPEHSNLDVNLDW